MTDAGILAAARRALRRQPSATTVTVTRVTGQARDPDGEPETVTVITEEPATPPASHRLAHTALVVASVALAVALSGIAYRAWRD